MKAHAHDKTPDHAAANQAATHSQPAAQTESAEATTPRAHAAHSASDHDVNHSPRQVAQRRLLGAAFGPVVQREPQGLDEELPVQEKAAQPAEAHRTGMPLQLQSGIEALSGLDMSDVRVHRNSDKPAQLNAHAYAQGNDIHLGPGQEQHLGHEAWHVVQQRQGRVQATTQLAGVGVNDDAALESEADLMGARAAGEPAQRVSDGQAQDPTQSASLGNGVAQKKIKPAKKISQYLTDYDSAKPKEKTALEELFGKLVESAFLYQEDDIHEAIRTKGLNPTALEALFQSLQESQSTDIDENLGGDRAHGVSRHYAISDKDLEARLRGPGAIATASRFDADEGTRVLKLHNLIRSALVKHLSTPAKQIGEQLHSVMHDPTDGYAALTTNANRRAHLQALADGYNDVIDEGEADSGFGFSISPDWRVQVAGAPAVVTIKCEFEVESWDDFDKDSWSLGPTGALVKGTATETARMFSGSNSPVIVITTGDALSVVTAQTKGIIEKSGVTLF